MSAACCTGRYRHTIIMFTTIHFDDRNVSEGLYMGVFIASLPCVQSWGFRIKRWQTLITITYS